MRKTYSLLALMLLMVMNVTAQKRYDAVDFGNDGQLMEITPGQNFVLKSAITTDAEFLNITDRNTVRQQSVIDDYSLFTFEVASDTTYYLKSVATGKWLEDPVYSSGAVRLTDAKLRAASIVVAHPYVYNSTDDVDAARQDEDPDYSYFTFTTDEVFGLEPFTWKLTAVTTDGPRMFASTATWNQYYNRNTWEFYLVEEKNSLASLEAILTEYCRNGEENLDIYIPGSDPGQVDQDLITEVYAAYHEAIDLLNTASEDDAANWAAYQRFINAWEACQNGIKPMRSGYFYFTNWRIESSGEWGDVKTPIPDNAVFEDEATHETYWSFKNGWTKPDVPTPADRIYIYYIQDNGDGTFYLQNYKTKRYLGYVSGNNKRIPTTEQPEEKIRITIHPTQPGYFSVISTSRESGSGNDVTYPAMHASGDYNAIVYWTPEADASAWKFREIPYSDIEAMEESVKQYERNNTLEALVAEAESDYAKGFSYSSDGDDDYYYDNPGLVTDVDQLWSNATDTEEGSLEELLDSDFATFFHSNWHDTKYRADGGEFQNIIADLGTEIEAVAVKITKRMGTGAPSNYQNNAPYKVHFYTTNSLELGYNEDGDEIWTSEDWHDQGVVYFNYPDAAELDGEEYANETGVNSCAFDGKYQYVRLDVESRGNGNTDWFNMSELRFYEATYDPSISLIEVVDADTRKALEDALKVAKDELLDEAATQETIDRLQLAYNNFIAAYPDPQRVLNLLTELEAQCEAAEEGTGLGYFQAGAKEELSAAIDAVRDNVKDVMSITEVNEALAALNAAYDVFNAKLNMPADGAYYRIRSATSSDANGSAANNYIYASGNGESQVFWGGYDDETGEDANIEARLDYIWKAVKNEDGSYCFFNMGTGTYMANNPLSGKVITMTNDVEKGGMSLRSAKVAGLFNLVQADGVFANAQPGTSSKLLVTWNSASGTDNSAFEFVNAEWNGAFYYDKITRTTPQPLTLPFEILVPSEEEATLYSVVGYNGNASDGYNLVLKAYATGETIPAATPFVVKMAAANSAMSFLIGTADELGQITYDLNAKTVNGLHGTLESVTLVQGCGYFTGSIVLLSEEGDTVAPNSGYLTDLTLTSETGDLQLPMENIPNVGIFNMTNGTNVPAAIYDLQGRRVMNAQKGLYIVNGKKVLVK